MTSKRRLIILLHRIALCVLGCGAFGSASAAEVEPRCRILLGPLTFEKDQQVVNPRTLQLVVSREGDCTELEAIEVLFSPTWTKIGIVAFEYELGHKKIVDFVGSSSVAEWRTEKRVTAVFDPSVKSSDTRSSGFTASLSACRFRGRPKVRACSAGSVGAVQRTVQADPVLWPAP